MSDSTKDGPTNAAEVSSGSESRDEEAGVSNTNKAASKVGRKRRAKAWKFFEEITDMNPKTGAAEKKAKCRFCPWTYTLNPSGTTTQLNRHMNQCLRMKMAKGENNKGILSFVDNNNMEGNANSVSGLGRFDPIKSKELLARMIVAMELPFLFVEHPSFNLWATYNNFFHQKVSRHAIKNECKKVYELEREKMKNVFKNVDRISLTSDCWTSNQTIGYMSLTAHYVDVNWKLQKRIIGFSDLSPPHSGEVIADAIVESLMFWGIENKIGTITLDNASNNDKAAGILKLNFEGRGKLHFQGLFFHVRCCAHILNLVVQDGLGKIECCIWKIRDCVRYLKKSPGRLENFGEIASRLGLSTKRSLCFDVKTRWNSTHRMLESALHYKKAFFGYALRDSNFHWCPTETEWSNAEKVYDFLGVFASATAIFSGTLYPTSNLFLEQIFIVKKTICDAYSSSDVFMKEMGIAMNAKFNKYWGEINVLMSMASILDPRHKLSMVEFCFNKLYPDYEVEDRVGDITSNLHTLFQTYANDYLAKASNISASSSNPSLGNATSNRNETQGDKGKAQMNEYYASQKMKVSSRKSDLTVYLEEPELVVNDKEKSFDVLEWWKVNSVKYPVLSNLARDILSIPISTVASESTFSAGGRVLDDYRSSLSKEMVEILVCGGDWIRANMNTFSLEEEAPKKEENLEIQIPMSNLIV